MIRGGLVKLLVRDRDRAVRFYVETLGMKLVEEAGTASAVIDAGEGFRLALTVSDASAPTSSTASSARMPSVGLTTKVPLADAIAIYENRGVTFDVKDDGAHFRDPDGNLLYLFQER